MPLYPDLTTLLREKLEKFSWFRDFSGGEALFNKINAQLEQCQKEKVTINVSAEEQEIDNFINNITLLAKGELNNICCFIELIEAFCLDERKKHELNGKLAIKRNKLIESLKEVSFSVSGINYLNELFSNKSNGFMLIIKSIIDKLKVENQYQSIRQVLLEKFTKFEKNDNALVPADTQELISYIVYFYQSHKCFKNLLRDVEFYAKQHEAMQKIELNSDDINLKKEELTVLEHELLEKIKHFVPDSKVVSEYWEDIITTFEAFKQNLNALEKANKFTLEKKLDNCEHELLKITKPLAYTFSSILVKQEELLENIVSLRAKLQACTSVESNFNENYQQYLSLKSQISQLLVFSSMKKPFYAFFNKTVELRMNAIDNYRAKLILLKNSLANEKAEIFNSIITKLRIIRDFERDATKVDSAALAKNVKELLTDIDKDVSALARFRNTALKSVFWCLFGMFRPQTTSIRLIKDIKEELTQFNTAIDEKIVTLSPGFF